MIHFENNKISSIDRVKCSSCMKCADACPADAIKYWGKEETVESLTDIILRDKEFFVRSHGGVTLSGGEPLIQNQFATALLKECKRHQIHTCVETTLFADWDVIEQIMPYTDLFISDLKLMDAELHRKYTGVTNEKIHKNMMKLVQYDKPLILRIPVIPFVNDTMENMSAAADFILTKLHNKVLQLQLLEYMHLGEEKYKSLDMDYPMESLSYQKETFSEKIKTYTAYFNNRGILCSYGTGTQSNPHEQTQKEGGTR